MQLHADRNKEAFVRSSDLEWVPSPLAGVERRMLERQGNEVARATTIVRYAPQSYFTAHTHTGGEEFLVLDGVFSDEHGDFPAGTYVRNPVGSSHTPHSEDGTTILVKLWQMPPEDQEYVRRNTLDDNAFIETDTGVAEMTLHSTDHEKVEMWRLDAGAQITAREFSGGVELFVTEGSCEVEGKSLEPRDWLRLPTGATLTLKSEAGARIFVKHGHLMTDLPLPKTE